MTIIRGLQINPVPPCYGLGENAPTPPVFTDVVQGAGGTVLGGYRIVMKWSLVIEVPLGTGL